MPPDLTRVAVYRRSVHASLERVWENVRDWEHLPWLHRTSFSGIALEDEGEWGWRARIDSQPARPGNGFQLELVIENEERRYVARALDGATKGGEIWTRLTPVDAARTDIEVEFLAPDVRSASIGALGAAYTALYTTLWDEDERMMMYRQAMLDGGSAAPPKDLSPVELGLIDEVRAKLPLGVEVGGRRYRVVDVDGDLLVHPVACPHMLGPLDEGPVADGCIECPWHGYRFDLRTGRSSDGQGLRLPAAPIAEIDGARVRLVWEPA